MTTPYYMSSRKKGILVTAAPTTKKENGKYISGFATVESPSFPSTRRGSTCQSQRTHHRNRTDSLKGLSIASNISMAVSGTVRKYCDQGTGVGEP